MSKRLLLIALLAMIPAQPTLKEHSCSHQAIARACDHRWSNTPLLARVPIGEDPHE